MNKAELIDTLAGQTGQTKVDITRTLDALQDTIETTIARGDKAQLVGFGTFEPQHRAARTGRNPQTGATLEIAAATLPKFSPGKAFKDRMTESPCDFCVAPWNVSPRWRTWLSHDLSLGLPVDRWLSQRFGRAPIEASR